jgi:hypothetical protein
MDSCGSSSSHASEMTAQLEEKFLITGKTSEKFQTLIALLKSWSIRKINRSSTPQII